MINLSSLKDEKTLITGLFLLLGFVYLTIGSNISMMFLILISAYGFIVLRTKKPFQFLNKFGTRTLLYAVIGVVLWFVIASFLANQLNPNSVHTVKGLGKLIFANTNIPVLSGVKVPEWMGQEWLTVFIWGFCFPIFETLGLLALSMTLFSRMLGISLERGFNFKSIKHWWFAALVGASCSLFHLVARQGMDFALFSDFIFFGLSVPIAMTDKQLFAVFLVHMVINLIVLAAAGFISLGGIFV